MTWEQATIEFKQYLWLEKNLSQNSIVAYESDIKKLSLFCIQTYHIYNPLEIEFKNLSSFIEALSKIHFNAASQARILSGIKSFYKFLVLNDYLEFNPSELLEHPKIGRKLPVTLEMEEIDLLIKTIDRSKPEGERNVAIIEVLYSCGLRVSELTNLTLTNMYWDEKYISVIGKGNKERIVPIGNTAIKHAKIYIHSIRNKLTISEKFRNIVFLNRRGGQLTRQSIFLMIKNAALMAGIKKEISPHTFRHSFATGLIERGADIRAVQEMLGHESITTTEIYTHLNRKYLADTIEKFHPRSL